MNLNSDGNLGIGKNISPSEKLDVDGKIRMRDGAQNGYIPVSDANGVMTWTSPNNIVTGPTGAIELDDLTDAKSDASKQFIFGHIASTMNATTDYNVAVGLTALDAVTTGGRNTSVGHQSLSATTSGEANTAVGSEALNQKYNRKWRYCYRISSTFSN